MGEPPMQPNYCNSCPKPPSDTGICGETEAEQPLEIEIMINSIENIVRRNTASLKFVIEHDDVVLRESQIYNIDATLDNPIKLHQINCLAIFSFTENDLKRISTLVSTPVLIKVFEISDNLSRQSFEGERVSKASRSFYKNELELLGICNVDLLPIVLGERSFDEKLVLELPTYTWDGSTVAWANLPRITVTVSYEDGEPILKEQNFNILNITVESLYNLPSFFTKNMEYKCGTSLYSDKPLEESYIVFEAGKWTDFHDVDRTKNWRSLQYLESRAKFSRYKIHQDYDTVKSDFKKEFDIKTAVKQNVHRVEWNTVQRIFLEPEDVENIRNRIIRYKNWRFEISVSPIHDDEYYEDEADEKTVYQCDVDTSQLLFPGKTRSRILTQLHSRNPFSTEESWLDPSALSVGCHCDDSKDEKHSQASVSSTVPLFNTKGQPVLLLVEFELYQPLLPARFQEDFTEVLETLKKQPKPNEPIYSYTPNLVEEQYINCVQQLVDVIADNYRDFLAKCDCESTCDTNKSEASTVNENVTCPYFYIPDELSQFKQYLHETGQYVSIRSALKSKIINLLDQKFVLDSSNWYSAETQKLVASCYAYLVDEMHTALNTKLDVRLSVDIPSPDDPNELWFRAEEAYETENYEKSDKLFTKIITDDLKNANSWANYAIHLMRQSKQAEATECCREAIRCNSRHRTSLLMYGVILAMNEEYCEAEIFLKSLTHFYPRFSEGWAILHLLYVKLQYYPGIDLTLDIAKKCLKDRVKKESTFHVIRAEPMAWSKVLARDNRIFLLTAALLLKLHLYQFAGLALVQEQCHEQRTVEFLYFLSVSYYLQRKYTDALHHLNEAERIIGMDYSIAALMGHCHYKTGEIEQAIELYEAVDMLYDRPESIHLVNLRMGFHYIDIEKYDVARNVFLRICKLSPTCRTWLGVGISNYFLGSFEECELALTEANRIDDEDPEVWAYLCLLSMSLQRYDEFVQCYRMTVKNNLRCDKLWRRITLSMATLGFSSPMFTFQNSTDRCECESTK